MIRRLARAAPSICVGARCLSFNPRVREYKFLSQEVHGLYQHYDKLGLIETCNSSLVDDLLDQCGKLCTGTLFPLYLSGDDEGCHLLADTTVTTPKGYKEAYKAIADGGWCGISSPEKYGGLGLAPSIGFMMREMMAAANWSLLMYPGLAAGASQTLLAWGSEEQKSTYLPKINSGEWGGTMCLTEPHCGTDLGQVKTRAEAAPDGTYRITGTKIFISAGEHDFTDNIVHIVLARLADSPPGTKGISLFLVPRHLIKADGALEPKKNVICTGIEKKMGIKASSTCTMTFDSSVGYLIGKPNEGMKEMFIFMNAARLGTAIQGVAHSELAFQNALLYARERGSMRAMTGTVAPDKPADPILCHPNVRGHILFAKAISEGGRCLVMDLAMMLDRLESPTTSDAEKKIIDGQLGFLTPIAKGCLTEWGLEAANHGMQVFGGHGFIKGNGMEQIVRDARIATLYEGTTGIQALDFIGRKVLMAKGNESDWFGSLVNGAAKDGMFNSNMTISANSWRLWVLQKQWKVAILRLKYSASKNKDTVGMASQDFLMATGLMTLGYYWLRMAIVASKKVAANEDADGFYAAKIATCAYFFEKILPRVNTHLEVMHVAPTTLMGSNADSWDL